MSEPLDLKALIAGARKAPEEISMLRPARKVYLTAPIVKPPEKGFFWRVRGGGDWDFTKNAFNLLPVKGGNGFMLVAPSLDAFVESKRILRSVIKPFGLAFVINTAGAPAFWALNLQDQGPWGTSARACAKLMENSWAMILNNGDNYIAETPEGDLAEPEWPEGSVEDWLERAFKGRVITTEDHPEILKLLGKC